jgi:hypothetical protein
MSIPVPTAAMRLPAKDRIQFDFLLNHVSALTKNKEYDLGIESLAKKHKEKLEELLSTVYKN